MPLPTYRDPRGALLAVDALAYARESITRISEGKIELMGIALSWRDPADGRRLAKEFLKRRATDPLGLKDVKELALAGWDLADEALRELIVEHEHYGREKPTGLKEYTIEITDPRRIRHKPRGRKKTDNYLRNIAITFLVGDVCWKFGLTPARQTESRHNPRRPNGCTIVAQALGSAGIPIGEAAVATIWQKMGRIAFPNLGATPYPGSW
jgi:hypothetical protein